MQLVHLATGALNQIDMTGVQRIKFAEHHTDIFLLPGKLQPQKTVQRLQLLRAGTFDLGIEKLTEIALGHSTGIRHLLQGTALLLDRGFQIIK